MQRLGGTLNGQRRNHVMEALWMLGILLASVNVSLHYALIYVPFVILAQMDKARFDYELAEKQFNIDVSLMNVQYMNEKRKAQSLFWNQIDAKYKF